VTEIYDCSRAPADERAGIENGKIWAEAMAETLERLDALCARQGNQPSPAWFALTEDPGHGPKNCSPSLPPSKNVNRSRSDP
jgi:hypothetical protein